MLTFKQYIKERLGISSEESEHFLTALREWLLLSMVRYRPANLPGIGTIKQINARRFNFRPSDAFKTVIDNYSYNGYELFLKEQESILTSKEDTTAIADALRGDLTPEEKDALHKRVRGNKLRMELLRYLHRDFAVKEDWKSPSGTVYSYWRIREIVLEIVRTEEPIGYEALYTLWVSLSNQRGKAETLDLTVEEMWYYLYKAIDLILVILILDDTDRTTIACCQESTAQRRTRTYKPRR